MSDRTFLGNIIKSVGTFLKRFFSKIDPQTEKYATIAISITNGIKTFVDSDMGKLSLEAIKLLIPGNIDDIAIDWAVNFIDTKLVFYIDKLKLIKTASEVSDPLEKAMLILDTVKESDNIEKVNFYIGLSAIILEAARDGQITQAEATVITQLIYHNKNNR